LVLGYKSVVPELISSYPGEEVQLRFGFLMKENRKESKMVNDCKEAHNSAIQNR